MRDYILYSNIYMSTRSRKPPKTFLKSPSPKKVIKSPKKTKKLKPPPPRKRVIVKNNSHVRRRRPPPRNRSRHTKSTMPLATQTPIQHLEEIVNSADPFEVDLNEDTRRLGARDSFLAPKGFSLNDTWQRHGAVSLKNTTPTYVYLGHGFEFSHKPDKEVPPGCTLSTITESSMGANIESVLLLCSLARTNKEMVTQPEKYYRELFDLYKGSQYNNTFQHKRALMEGELHLNKAGDKYQNKSSTFILDFHNKKGKGIISLFRSGLYDLSTPGLELPRIDGGEIFDKSSIDIKQSGLTVGNIRDLYKGCVFPNIDDILENVKKDLNTMYRHRQPDLMVDTLTDDMLIPFRIFQYAMSTSANMNVDQLMEKFPGNHYFFICRNPREDLEFAQPYENVLQHRQLSKNRAEAMLGKPIVPTASHGLTLKAQQHFRRQLQEVFNTHFKGDNKDFISQEYSGFMNVIKEEFFDIFIRDKGYPVNRKGEPMPEITEMCNAIIQKINDELRIHEHTYVHIDHGLLDLIRQSQEFETATRFELDKEILDSILNK